MRIGFALLLVALLGPFALAGTGLAELRVMKEGEVLAPVALRGVDGGEVAIPGSPFPPGEKGVTVVVFWSTWSPRSAPLLALWQKLAAEYAARPVRVVTVNADHQEMDAEKVAAVKSFLAENGITLATAIDQGLAFYNQIGVIALPTTLFFDAAGALVGEEPGFPSSATVAMGERLDRELGIAKAAEEEKPRGALAYQPRNNALLYFNMGVNLRKIGMREKARGKFAEALQRDPEYADPLLALEGEYFQNGRSSQSVEALRDFLLKANLPALADRYR